MQLKRSESGRRGVWKKGVKRHDLPVLREISARDIVYDLRSSVHAALGDTGMAGE